LEFTEVLDAWMRLWRCINY